MYVQVSPDTLAATAAAASDNAAEAPDPEVRPAGRHSARAVWRPRIGASHLMKGAQGIYYLRLAIPECVRALNPGLPKELKRSTLQAEKRAALAQARQMCVDFMTSLKLPKDEEMLVPGHTDSQAFTIHYADGGVDIKVAPNAKPETVTLALRIMNHVYVQVLGRTVRDSSAKTDLQPLAPSAPPPLTLPAEPDPAKCEPVAAPQPIEGPPASERVQLTAAATEAHAASNRPVWLFDAIEIWRHHDGVTFSDKTWKHSYSSTFRIFRELLGNERRDLTLDDGTLSPSQLDRRLDTITRTDIESLYTQLKAYPARQGKRLDGIEAPECIALARAQKQRVQSPANVDKLLSQIRPFLNFMDDKGWISSGICKEMKLQQQAATQRKNKAEEAKPNGATGAIALAIDELKSTFHQPAYRDGAIKSDWAYFIDPIRLYMAPRVSEVAQLYVEDIIEIDGVPCISFAPDVTPDPDEDEASDPRDRKSNKGFGPQTEAEFRRLKNKASRRIVPIHPALIEMGFLDYVASRRLFLDRGDALLFSGLTWNSKSGYGRKPSEHTLDLLKKAGVWQYRRKVGHSLRSNAAQEFKRVGMDPDLIQRVLGHSTGKLHDSAYGKTDQGPALPVQRVLEFMSKTDFGVTFPRRDEILELQVEYARNKQASRRRAGN